MQLVKCVICILFSFFLNGVTCIIPATLAALRTMLLLGRCISACGGFTSCTLEVDEVVSWCCFSFPPECVHTGFPLLFSVFPLLLSNNESVADDIHLLEGHKKLKVAYTMLRWVAANVPGRPALAKHMCGKHCIRMLTCSQ